jgi:hypothetical protein
MSFAIHVPCSCVKTNKIISPPFIDKLEIRNGIYDIKAEFSSDNTFEKEYDNWRFCEHNQIATEMDLGQSIIGIKPFVKNKYGVRFNNLISFLPDYNAYYSTQYSKTALLEELKELRILEPQYIYRWDQFVTLVEVAVKNETWVYF